MHSDHLESDKEERKSVKEQLEKYKAILEFLAEENNMDKFRESVKKEVEKRGLDPNNMSDKEKRDLVMSVLMNRDLK